MSRLFLIASAIFTAFFLTVSIPTFADEMTVTPAQTTTTTTSTTNADGVTVEKKVIVTTVPAAKEVVVTPTGYANCFTVNAGWVNDVWVPEHRVCQYTNSPSGVAWVEGYWACNSYKSDTGECTNWDWKAAHWTKVLDVY